MNIDANISQSYNRARHNQGRNRSLTSKFHFNLNDDNANKTKSENPPEKGVTENLWKMYSKARELLPYKERMENLTWRMMYVNNQQDYRKVKEHKSEPDSSFSSSEVTSSSVSPDFDEFDYKSHIQKMAQDNTSNSTINSSHNNNSNSTKKRPADFSPLITSSKPHSNLSASLAAVKKQPLESQFESDGAFSFQLDQMAFEGPALNFSESFHSDSQSQTPILRGDSRSHTPSLASQGSLIMQMENKANNNNNHMSSSFDSHHSSSFPLQTIGPSTILNGFSNGHLERQNSSMVSLNEHFRSQSNTPFTNQLNNQNTVNFENTGQNPPYPLVHSNSFIIQESPGLNSLPKSISQTGQSISTTFDSYDYSTSATSTSYFDSFNKNSFPLNSNSLNQNKRVNTEDTFSSSLPTFLHKTFSNETKNSAKKGKTIKSKKKQTRIVSPDFNGPLSKKEDKGPISCTNCNTTATPLWRRDPKGKPLCNACGLFLKLHGVVRPLSLKTDVIKKRQRGANTSSKKLVSGPTDGDGDNLDPTPIDKTTPADVDVSPKHEVVTPNSKTSSVKKPKPTRKNSKIERDKPFKETSVDPNDNFDVDTNLDPINELDYNMDYLNHSPSFSIPNFQLHVKTEGEKSDWDWLGMA